MGGVNGGRAPAHPAVSGWRLAVGKAEPSRVAGGGPGIQVAGPSRTQSPRSGVRPPQGTASCLEVGLSALAQPRLTKGGQPYPYEVEAVSG